MNDRPETATDPQRLDRPAPPPGPWWSQPRDPWGAAGSSSGSTPAQAPAGGGASGDASGGGPLDGSRSAGSTAQPPYGAWSEPDAPPRREQDPWSSPTTTAVFGTGAQAWGYPVEQPGRTDTIGSDGAGRPRRRFGQTAALVLATALIAGAVGGLVGARTGGSDLDPTASLGSSSGTAPAVDRAPDSVAGIAAAVMRTTVSIAVRGGAGRGTGSGVVIRPDGYILTNNHVVAPAANGGEITVTFDGTDGRGVPARIVGRDPITDLAVLRIDVDRQLEAATLGQSRSLVVGDPVIAIGSPLGLSGTVTTGIVSALNRTVDVPAEAGGGRNPLFNAIQTDAAINPGNSGGALVNAEGEVIGINSAIATLGGGAFGEAGGSIGVGFAIPIDEAASVAEEIIRTGKATHPAIGVSALTVSGEDREGAQVRELVPGGAAAGGGLQPGDLITRVEDTQVRSVDELILAVRQHAVGDTVTVTYVRDGQSRTAELTLQDLAS
jgi:putative serine protease PepD